MVGNARALLHRLSFGICVATFTPRNLINLALFTHPSGDIPSSDSLALVGENPTVVTNTLSKKCVVTSRLFWQICFSFLDSLEGCKFPALPKCPKFGLFYFKTH